MEIFFLGSISLKNHRILEWSTAGCLKHQHAKVQTSIPPLPNTEIITAASQRLSDVVKPNWYERRWNFFIFFLLYAASVLWNSRAGNGPLGLQVMTLLFSTSTFISFTVHKWNSSVSLSCFPSKHPRLHKKATQSQLGRGVSGTKCGTKHETVFTWGGSSFWAVCSITPILFQCLHGKKNTS